MIDAARPHKKIVNSLDFEFALFHHRITQLEAAIGIHVRRREGAGALPDFGL